MMDYIKKGLIGACLEIKNNNYGSMLQSFATQQMLKNYNIRFELLDYRKKYTPIFVLKSIPRLLNKVVWQDKFNEYEKKSFLKKHPELDIEVETRKNMFTKFRNEYFNTTIVTYYGYDELKKNSTKYSAFLTGSDQLWSPSGLPTNFYNLMFAHEDSVKISYASSFGVKQIPWYQIRRTKEYLQRINYISCREQSGGRIVKKLINRDVLTVADPTMLFDAEQWKKMLPIKRVQKGKYIFSYILGTNKEYREVVKKISKETGLPIVSIHQYVEADLNFGDISIIDAGPAEFVDLIRNAEFVCTDSFHGSVFSILNHKKFLAFNRYKEDDSASKNTRIDNLLSELELTNRRYSGNNMNEIMDKINYGPVEKRINEIRKKSIEYLESAFSAIKNVEGEKNNANLC